MHLFTYGTLMDIHIMTRVTGERSRSESVILHNYIRKTVRNELYPAITPCNNYSVEGILYLHVSDRAIERLDRFEGHLYTRTMVSVINANNETIDACSYVLADNAIEYLSELDWNYENFIKHHRDIYQEFYQGYVK